MYVLEFAGEDDAFAAREAASACSAVAVVAPGLARARGVTDRVRGLAYTRRASELVGYCAPTVDDAVACLRAAAVERAGTVAVRARDVRGSTGVDTRTAERELGAVLVERGFEVDLDDPDHELRALCSAPAGDAQGDENAGDPSGDGNADDERDAAEGAWLDAGDGPPGVCALGWLADASVRDFGARKPTDKPFFQPGSMSPLLARALANVAGARPGATLLDPMCGTGGVLVEAGLVGADVVGNDAQYKMVHGARENLGRYLAEGTPGLPSPGGFDVVRGDATRLAVRDDAVDGVVFDAPYGRQSKIENRSLDALVADALAEARRVVRPGGRAVVVADRSWDAAARDAGWTVESAFERRVHRSLTRHVRVLES